MSKPLLVTLAALLVPATASAWTHTGFAWVPQEDFPLEFYVAPRADCEETVVDAVAEPGNYCLDMTQRAHDTWAEQAGCASLSNVYLGEAPNTGFTVEFENRNSFNDPGSDGDITTRNDDDITDPGTLAVTRSWPGENLFVFNGQVYVRNVDADIVYENDTFFGTPDDMGPGCSGRTNIQSVGTHEVGHLYGMGHSCEKDEPCVEPVLLAATMYWSSAPCTTEGEDLNADDIEGITALYGPSASFTCSHELSDELATGNVPFELKCVVVSDFIDEITAVEWRWGDGAVTTGNESSHVYDTAGNYTVEVVVEGDRESCGEDGWTNTFRKVGFVRACAEPIPEFRIEHVDGLKYAMMNDTDVSVYGCYTNIEWQVFEGPTATGEPISELTYNGWEPNIVFPDDGEYTVVLNIGGPAGTGAASLTFEADDHRGDGYAGCNSAATTGGAGLASLAGLAALLRRRARRA